MRANNMKSNNMKSKTMNTLSVKLDDDTRKHLEYLSSMFGTGLAAAVRHAINQEYRSIIKESSKK
jgi:hypothetical protein